MYGCTIVESKSSRGFDSKYIYGEEMVLDV